MHPRTRRPSTAVSLSWATRPARVLATGFFSILSTFGDDALREWAWRLPFLCSALLILVGLVVRLKVEESPVFESEVKSADVPEMLPLKYALVTNWRPIILGIGILPVAVGGYYLVTTFITAYATDPRCRIVGDVDSQRAQCRCSGRVDRDSRRGVARRQGGTRPRRHLGPCGSRDSRSAAVPGAEVRISVPDLPDLRCHATGAGGRVRPRSPPSCRRCSSRRPATQAFRWRTRVQARSSVGCPPLVSTLMYKATGSIWPVIALLIGMCVLSIVCLLFAPQHVDEATDTDGAPQGLNKESASA